MGQSTPDRGPVGGVGAVRRRATSPSTWQAAWSRPPACRELLLRGGRQRRVRSLLLIWLLLLVADGCGQSAVTEHSGSLIVRVTAGPTCPVERAADPTCAPRPVKGARLSLHGPSEMTLTTDATGTARAGGIPVGAYRMVAQPVHGLRGPLVSPRSVLISQGHATHAAVSYDTGIR